MMPNFSRVSVVPNAMEKFFVTVATPRTNSKMRHIYAIKKRKGRNNIWTNKPNKELVFFQNI